MAEISLDELLAEYNRLGRITQTSGLTMLELAQKWGVSISAARKSIRKFHAAGWVKSGRKKVPDISGRENHVPCYIIELPKKTTKK